jgi:DNA-binding NtrC family response regulator
MVGKQVPIETGLVIGRILSEAEVLPQLCVRDSRVSRKHAIVRRVGASLEISDAGSRNGTFVDGVRSWSASIVPGAIVRVGNTLLELNHLGKGTAPAAGALIGQTAVFEGVLEQVARAARSDLTVMLFGETGTGKEVAARAIHERSGRSGQFIAINCAAIPAELSESTLFGHRKGAFTGAATDALGFFGEAEGGTIFLDEIGELPLAQQAKLLRVLENREYTPVGSTRPRTTDARVIAATNVDLAAAVSAGRFRDDLLARLLGTVIHLPSLRERRGDIPLLARRFLAEIAPNRRLELDAGALERMLAHPWRHNVRELRAFIHRLVHLKDGDALVQDVDVEEALGAEGTRPRLAEGSYAGPIADRWSEDRPQAADLVELLRRNKGNVARVASHYGKDTKQIYRWLKRYQLAPDEYR